ncbi:MAG: hypothetical protein WC476_04665 [Phycisphaerae bacterium]|jgi:hypothetical protein
MSKHISIIVLCGIVLAVAICGCAGGPPWLLDLIANTKCSIWRKADIRFRGTLDIKSGQRKFVRLYVGNPAAYAERLPSIYIEWPNREKILLSTITADMLAKMDDVRVDNGIASFPREEVYPRVSWPDETRYYIVRCYTQPGLDSAYSFAVIKNQIAGFIAYDECQSLGLWNESSTKRYQFPMTQDEVEELFGQPDEIVDYLCY